MFTQFVDIHLGDAHLVLMDDITPAAGENNDVYVSLMVTQHRDRKGSVSGIHLNHLSTALSRLASACLKLKGTCEQCIQSVSIANIRELY